MTPGRGVPVVQGRLLTDMWEFRPELTRLTVASTGQRSDETEAQALLGLLDVALSARVPVSAVTGGVGARGAAHVAARQRFHHHSHGLRPRPSVRPCGRGDGMRVAEDVSALELADYSSDVAGAAPPADPAIYPDA
jgi:hypothetical protein